MSLSIPSRGKVQSAFRLMLPAFTGGFGSQMKVAVFPIQDCHQHTVAALQVILLEGQIAKTRLTNSPNSVGASSCATIGSIASALVMISDGFI